MLRVAGALTMRAWPVARSIFDAPFYVREANERTTGWITGAPEGCRFAAAGPNNVRQEH